MLVASQIFKATRTQPIQALLVPDRDFGSLVASLNYCSMGPQQNNLYA
jgi:hypothetical protein